MDNKTVLTELIAIAAKDYGIGPTSAEGLIRAVLAKLGQPADSDADQIERALSELVDKIVPGLDSGDLVADAKEASRHLDQRAPSEAGAVPVFRLTMRGGEPEFDPTEPAFKLPDGEYDLYATLPPREDDEHEDDNPMRLAIALDFADNPRPYHTLQAPADTNGELYRALKVLAAAYRLAVSVAAPPSAPAAQSEKQAAQWFMCDGATPDSEKLVIVAGTMDGPHDWRVKLGWYSAETRTWHVDRASWKPIKWTCLPDPAAPPAPSQQAAPAAVSAEPANPDKCNADVFTHGVSMGVFGMTKQQAEAYCKAETARTGRLHDWHYVAGRVHVKTLIAQPTAATADAQGDERAAFVAAAAEHWKNSSPPDNAWIGFQLGAAWARQPSAPAGAEVSQAARDVLAERRRQIDAEGWTPEHDDQHNPNELAEAGACYAMAFENHPMPMDWPWEVNWWKPKDRRSNLVKAGALILAEIERLDRAAVAAAKPEGGSHE